MFFSIKLILPGPGFKPVTSRVAGMRFPCILSHLTQVTCLIPYPQWVSELRSQQHEVQSTPRETLMNPGCLIIAIHDGNFLSGSDPQPSDSFSSDSTLTKI